VLGVFLPWAVVVVGLFVRFQDKAQKNVSTNGLIRIALIGAGLCGGTLIVSLVATTLCNWSLFGISDFAPHYLQPFCILAALGIAGLIAARVDSSAFSQHLSRISLVTALTIFVVKLALFYTVPTGSAKTNLIPYKGLAYELDARGFGQAQFVARSATDAGNLLMYLPRARALAPSRRNQPPPPDPLNARHCVFIWGGEHYERRSKVTHLGLPPTRCHTRAPLNAHTLT
jgi:hypothetical protein